MRQRRDKPPWRLLGKEFDDPSRDSWQKPELVVAAMQIAPGMTVADIGAGTGYFEPHLSRAVGPNGRVLALDVEPDMVRYLSALAAREQLANVDARQGAPDDPGLPRRRSTACSSSTRGITSQTERHTPRASRRR